MKNRKGNIARGKQNSIFQRSENIGRYGSFQTFSLKGVCHEIFWVLFWHVWIDLGLYKNLGLFLIFSVEPLILYLRLKCRRGLCEKEVA